MVDGPTWWLDGSVVRVLNARSKGPRFNSQLGMKHLWAWWGWSLMAQAPIETRSPDRGPLKFWEKNARSFRLKLLPSGILVRPAVLPQFIPWLINTRDVESLWEFFLNLSFSNGTFSCIFYFPSTAGPPNVAGAGMTYPFPLFRPPWIWHPGLLDGPDQYH